MNSIWRWDPAVGHIGGLAFGQPEPSVCEPSWACKRLPGRRGKLSHSMPPARLAAHCLTHPPALCHDAGRGRRPRGPARPSDRASRQSVADVVRNSREGLVTEKGLDALGENLRTEMKALRQSMETGMKTLGDRIDGVGDCINTLRWTVALVARPLRTIVMDPCHHADELHPGLAAARPTALRQGPRFGVAPYLPALFPATSTGPARSERVALRARAEGRSGEISPHLDRPGRSMPP